MHAFKPRIQHPLIQTHSLKSERVQGNKSQHSLMNSQLGVEYLTSFWIFALFNKSWILYIKVGWHSQNKNLTQVVPIWKTNYQNDSQPFNCLTKGSNQLTLRRWICYWKTLLKSYDFAIKSFQFGGKMKKVMNLFRSFKTKCHFDVTSTKIIQYIIRRRVVCPLEFELWWILWVHVSLWFVHAPFLFQITLIIFFSWFLQFGMTMNST